MGSSTAISEGWQPAFDEVSRQSKQAQEVEGAGSVSGVRISNGYAVEKRSHSERFTREITLSSAAIDAANGSLHEKMSPWLSAVRNQPTSDGEPGMTSRTSWIGRLLSRDAAPIVSILPGEADEEADDVATVAALSFPQPTVKTVETEIAPIETDGCDASLANRLQQISGNWLVASDAVPATDIAEFKESHRLQNVAPEPVAIEGMPAVAEVVVVALESPAPVAKVTPRVRRGPAAWAISDKAINETAPAIAAPSPEAFISHALALGARCTPTFRELIEQTANLAAASTEVAGLESVPHVSEAEPFHSTTFKILGQVSEYAPSFDVIPPGLETTAQVGLHANLVTPAAEQAFEEPVPSIASMDTNETPRLPGRELVPEFVDIPPVPQTWKSTFEPVPDALDAEVPEFHFSDRYLVASKRQRTDVSAYAPYPPSSYELDDIEPAYLEASRSLNIGRWDPIPPLRPSLNGWRDRPSPVPAHRSDLGLHRSGAVKDGFNSHPPQRWIPEDILPVDPEPLSEPMLSRQWGLLSKFQQARISSSRPVAGGDAGKDTGRDADRPGPPYGDRRS